MLPVTVTAKLHVTYHVTRKFAARWDEEGGARAPRRCPTRPANSGGKDSRWPIQALDLKVRGRPLSRSVASNRPLLDHGAVGSGHRARRRAQASGSRWLTVAHHVASAPVRWDAGRNAPRWLPLRRNSSGSHRGSGSALPSKLHEWT